MMTLTAEEQRKVTRAIVRLGGVEQVAQTFPMADAADPYEQLFVVAVSESLFCRAAHENYICTRPPHDDEPHVAHVNPNRPVHVWFNDGTVIPLAGRQ